MEKRASKSKPKDYTVCRINPKGCELCEQSDCPYIYCQHFECLACSNRIFCPMCKGDCNKCNKKTYCIILNEYC